MPSGALMQLVSYGSEDLYLTGNPQITLFKVVYKRHTNFAYEWIPINFNPTLSFDTVSFTQMSAPIQRNGDLVRDMVLVIDTPNIFSSADENFKWIPYLGHVWVHYADFIVGGQRINREYGQWMNIWAELAITTSQEASYSEMIGNVPAMRNPSVYYGSFARTGVFPSITKSRLRIPLPFWFTTHPGLAYPLIAVQYVETRVDIEFRQLNDLFVMGIPAVSPTELFQNPSTAPTSNHLQLRQDLIDQGFSERNIFWKFVNGTTAPGNWSQNTYLDVKYVFLDNPERRLFAAAVSEYLITQVERLVFTGLRGGNNREDIEFFHPVKEMVWVFQRDDVQRQNQWSNYTALFNDEDIIAFRLLNEQFKGLQDLNAPGITQASLNNALLPSGQTVAQFIQEINCTDSDKLPLTQIDAFDQYVNIMYFGEFIFNGHRRQDPKTWMFYHAQEPFDAHNGGARLNRQVYNYSFAEHPEMVQPTGSADFSRFQLAQFQFTLKERLPTPECGFVPELYNLYFYVRNINILRIMNGIAGLVFAN